MLQIPSTGSIYAKPVKKCFVSAPGTVILTADFSALEDRVLASITEDKNKCAILEDGIDGHSLGACTYYPSEVSKHINLTGDLLVDAVTFYNAMEAGNDALKTLRQNSKAVTFKLAYQGGPDVDKGGVITQEMYDNYHTKLYPGVRTYIDEYVLPTVKQNGKLHLGLGFYISSDYPDKDYRTLHNATIQFWSILSILSINKLHQLIDQAGLQDDVKVISSIYDSIYIQVTEDPSIIKWTNDNLITCMTRDFMPNQRVKNEAESEIGLNWADLYPLPNNSDELTISMTLELVNNNLSDTVVKDHTFVSTYKFSKEHSETFSSTSIQDILSWRTKCKQQQDSQ